MRALILLTLFTTSCSWTLMDPPRQPHYPKDEPKCSVSMGPSLLDLLNAIGGLTVASVALDVEEGEDLSASATLAAAAGIVYAGVFVISGVTGEVWSKRCRKMEADHERWLVDQNLHDPEFAERVAGLPVTSLKEDYDRFSDVTARAFTVRIPTAVAVGYSSMIAKHSFPGESYEPGEHGAVLTFGFFFERDGWTFMRDHRVYFIIDQERFAPGTDWDGDAVRGSIVHEVILVHLDPELAAALSAADSVEFRIGSWEAALPEEAVAELREFMRFAAGSGAPPVQTADEPETEPADDPGTEPAGDPGAEPAGDPGTEPAGEPQPEPRPAAGPACTGDPC